MKKYHPKPFIKNRQRLFQPNSNCVKEVTMKFFRSAVLIIIVLFVGSAPAYSAPCFSKVVVFGDSNVDSGAESEYSLFHLTYGYIPDDSNADGRSCNGPVVVEYVADMLGVPLENYGIGGARTGKTNLVWDLTQAFPDVQYSGVLSQLQWFEDSLEKKRTDKNALYIYWAGSNDLYGATPEDLTQRIDAALDNIETALARLVELGAHHILVATRTATAQYFEPDNINGVIFNARLRVHLQRLNEKIRSKIQIFEAFDLISDMTYNPHVYGFIETTARCDLYIDCIEDPSISDTYITWDNAHKTTRVHEIMAEALVLQALNMKGNKGRCSKKHWKKYKYDD
jgi:phospholipase/lecithinase/hemolysin